MGRRNIVGPTQSGTGGTASLSAGDQAKVDNLPAVWQPNTAYGDGDGVIYNGVIYTKNGAGNSGATFTPSNWNTGSASSVWNYTTAANDPTFAAPLTSLSGYILPGGGSVALNTGAADGDWWNIHNASLTQQVTVRFSGGTWEGEILSSSQDATIPPNSLFQVIKQGTTAKVIRLDPHKGDLIAQAAHGFTIPTVGFIAARWDTGSNAYVQANDTNQAETAIVRIIDNDHFLVIREAKIDTAGHGLPPGSYLVLDSAGNAVVETVEGPQRVAYVSDSNTILLDIDGISGSGGGDSFQIVGLDENRACPNTTGLQFTVQAVNVSAGPVSYSIVGSGGAVANPAIDSNTGVVTYDSPTPINNGLGYIDISATDSNSKVVTQRIQIQQAPPVEESGLGGNDNIVRFSTPFGAGDTRITSYGQQGLSIDSLGGTADQIFSDAGATAAASNGGNVLAWLNNGTGENWKVSTGNGKNGPELIIGGGPAGNDALSFDSANEEHLWMHDPSTPVNQAFASGIVYNITSLPEYGSLISFGSINNGHGDMNNTAGGTPGAVQISRGGEATTNDFVFALNNGLGASNATITNDVHNDISDGNWHLLTCYYDGAGNVRVYIDGVEVVNFAITNPSGIVCNTVRLMQNRGGNAHVTGLVSDFIWLDNPTLEQVDRMQANLLFRNGFPLSNLAANAAPFNRDALFYTAPSDYILQTYCDGSVQVYDSNSGTYFDETNMPVPGIGLFLGANAQAVINEAQSGGGVQSVTGAAVDNTDPLNPVITSSGGPADTDALPEGSTNLYYTEARVNANPNVATNTAKTGITTLQANSITANSAKVSADGSINSHSDVDTSTATPNNGEALVWDGSNWVPTSLAPSPSGLQNSIQLTGNITPSAFTEPTEALYWNTSSNSHTVTLIDGNWPIGSVVHFINFNNLGNIQVSMSGASILDASDVLTSYPVYGGSKLTLTKVAASSWLILNHTDQLIGDANLTGGSQQLLTAGSLTFANAYATYRALRYEFIAVEGANRYSLGAAYSESVSDFITAVMSDTVASPLVAFSLNSGNQTIAIAAGLGAGATNYDSLEVKVYGVR